MIGYIKNGSINKAASLHKKYLKYFMVFYNNQSYPNKKVLYLKGMDEGFQDLLLYDMETVEEEFFSKLLIK